MAGAFSGPDDPVMPPRSSGGAFSVSPAAPTAPAQAAPPNIGPSAQPGIADLIAAKLQTLPPGPTQATPVGAVGDTVGDTETDTKPSFQPGQPGKPKSGVSVHDLDRNDKVRELLATLSPDKRVKGPEVQAALGNALSDAQARRLAQRENMRRAAAATDLEQAMAARSIGNRAAMRVLKG